ncbi:hypothetical protein TPHA_0H00290 [Tetrapisispora phaffii CBS 4417]|uniref:Uncharacterized protein n=1 Tax=Tetrapisispora phaffii (strain ATCC 24235 / CBS 4417 / NBRC 1672 / NRRL Y-8282 / UCD 70-5) TaxID=1071381 RepID=G8BWT5_TETPH|nr:hypothetical protein TPHA_0H00290 [Tetrapisispora phaffii CBS 4417]CCE64239.1 hypothetical protein TPHA_0H00290 [Tetrapisispora phaffii CBS 4417]
MLLQPTLSECHRVRNSSVLRCRGGKGAASTLFRSSIIMHGGIIAAEDNDGDGDDDALFDNNMYMLDLISRKWRVLDQIDTATAAPRSRCRHSIVGCGSSFFFFGGITKHQTTNENIITNELWELQFSATNKVSWKKHNVPSFVEKKFDCKIIALNDSEEAFDSKLLIVGGKLHRHANTHNSSNKIDIFNVTRKKWEKPILLATIDARFASAGGLFVNTENSVIFENMLCFYDCESSSIFKIRLDHCSKTEAQVSEQLVETVNLPIHLAGNTSGTIYKNSFLLAGHDKITNGFICLALDLVTNRLLQINTHCPCNLNDHDYLKIFMWTSHFQIVCLGRGKSDVEKTRHRDDINKNNDAKQNTKKNLNVLLTLTLPFLQRSMLYRKTIKPVNNTIVKENLMDDNKTINENDDETTTNNTYQEGEEINKYFDLNINRKQIPDKKEHIASTIPASQFAKYVQYIESPASIELNEPALNENNDSFNQWFHPRQKSRANTITKSRSSDVEMNVNTIYNTTPVKNNSVFPVYAMVLGKDMFDVFGRSLADFELISKDGDTILAPTELLRKRWGRYFDFLLTTGISGVTKQYQKFNSNDNEGMIHSSNSNAVTITSLDKNNPIANRAAEENFESNPVDITNSCKSDGSMKLKSNYSIQSLSNKLESNIEEPVNIETMETNGMVFRVPFQDNITKKDPPLKSSEGMFLTGAFSLSSPSRYKGKVENNYINGHVFSDDNGKMKSRSASSLSNHSNLSPEVKSLGRPSNSQNTSNFMRTPGFSYAGQNNDECNLVDSLTVKLPDASEPPTIPLVPVPTVPPRASIQSSLPKLNSDAGPLTFCDWFKQGSISSNHSINGLKEIVADYSPRGSRCISSGQFGLADHSDTMSSSTGNNSSRRNTFSSRTNLMDRRSSIRTNQSRSIGSASSIVSSGASASSESSLGDATDYTLDLDPLFTPRGLYLPWSTATVESFTEFFFTGRVNANCPVRTVILDLLVVSKLYEVPLLYSLTVEALFTILIEKKANLKWQCHLYKSTFENVVNKYCERDVERSSNVLRNNKLYQSILKILESAEELDDGFYSNEISRRLSSIVSQNNNHKEELESSVNSQSSVQNPTSSNDQNDLEERSSLKTASNLSSRRTSSCNREPFDTASESNVNNVENADISDQQSHDPILSESKANDDVDQLTKYLKRVPDASISDKETQKLNEQLFSLSSEFSQIDFEDLDDTDSFLSDLELDIQNQPDIKIDDLLDDDQESEIVSQQNKLTDLDELDPLLQVKTTHSEVNLETIHNDNAKPSMESKYIKKQPKQYNNSHLLSLDYFICNNAVPADDSLIFQIYKKAVLVNDLRLMISCVDCLDISKRLNVVSKSIDEEIKQIDSTMKVFEDPLSWRQYPRKTKSSDSGYILKKDYKYGMRRSTQPDSSEFSTSKNTRKDNSRSTMSNLYSQKEKDNDTKFNEAKKHPFLKPSEKKHTRKRPVTSPFSFFSKNK